MIAAFVVWAVSGSAAALRCEWPSVATFRVGETKCTATLVHPQVVVTAAHCLEAGPAGRMRFGEDFSPYEIRVDVEACFVQTDYFQTRDPRDDYAACVLAEPLPEIPIVPVAMGCDTAALVPGNEAAIVGFGLPEPGGLFGIKHWGATTITDRSLPGGLIEVGDANVNGCLGDSGGPGFVRLPDQTWRAFGILVAGPSCGQGPSIYARIDDRMAWFEEQTGFDFSPCHAADGSWQGGADCADFSADPLTASTTWDESCGAERHTPAAACPEGLQDDPDGGDGGSESSGESSNGPDSSASEDSPPGGCGCKSGEPSAPVGVMPLVFVFWRRRAI